MFETKRTYTIKKVDAAYQLADWLTQMTWCGCNGFEYNGYLFLNDSTSPDGAQEYAIYRILNNGQHKKTESVTFGWMSYQEAVTWIKTRLTKDDAFPTINATVINLDDNPAHRCFMCA